MLSYDKLTKAQRRWVDLVEILFSDIYNRGKITNLELKHVHEVLMKQREKDKNYKVGWPIWLIMNNSISRGVYQIPRSIDEAIDDDKDKDHPYYAEYMDELKQFKVVA